MSEDSKPKDDESDEFADINLSEESETSEDDSLADASAAETSTDDDLIEGDSIDGDLADETAQDEFDDIDLHELERESEAIEKPKEYVAYGDRSTLNDLEKKSTYSTATGRESQILLILALIAAIVPVCFLLSWIFGLGGDAAPAE